MLWTRRESFTAEIYNVSYAARELKGAQGVALSEIFHNFSFSPDPKPVNLCAGLRFIFRAWAQRC